METKKCLLTGAGGFIGSHLVTALQHEGHKVINIPHEMLVLDPASLDKFIPKDIDWVFHLAAAGNIYGKHDDLEIFTSNMGGIFNLLQATKDIPYKAFINVSTSSVTLPHQTMYSATKHGAEDLCRAYVDEYHKPIVSIRLFTVIGRGEPKEHLIPTLIRSCMKGEKMPFNPYPVHDFIDVRDVVDGMIEISKSIDNYSGDIVGMGTGDQTTNQHILEIVEEATGKKANIELRDDIKRPYDTDKWRADYAEDYITQHYTLDETIKWMI